MSMLLGTAVLRAQHGCYYTNQSSSDYPHNICIRLGPSMVPCRRKSWQSHLTFALNSCHFVLPPPLPQLCAAVSLLCNFVPAARGLEHTGGRG